MTKRQPDERHTARGTDRVDRKRPPLEATAEPLPPSWIAEHDAAMRYWRAKAPTLAAEGLLTALDVETLATWCLCAVAIEECAGSGKVPGRDLVNNFRQLGASLGLSPESRRQLTGKMPTPPREGGRFDDV